jgi:trans-aconitate methyltransferase
LSSVNTHDFDSPGGKVSGREGREGRDPELFAGTAGYYATFRPPIPASVVTSVVDGVALDGRGVLLDVGTGTGEVILAFRHAFEEFVGLEPDEAMLSYALARLGEDLPESKLHLVHGAAPELPSQWEPYRAVIFSRSFHWVDVEVTAKRCWDALAFGGACVVMGDGSFWTGDEAWQETVRHVVKRWLGEARRAGASAYSPPARPFEDVLADAGFEDIRQTRIPERRTWTIDSIFGYLYSTSFSARHLYGERIGAFEAELRKELEASNPSGTFTEHAGWGIWTSLKVHPNQKAR